MATASDLYQAVDNDRERAGLPFSPDFEAAQSAILGAADDDAREKHLAAWLGKHQPCLFGKLAAKKGMIEYCFLTEADLLSSDEHIRDRIHVAHRRWREAALAGKKSGFIILAASERLCRARPSLQLLALLSRLGALYLNEEQVEPDRIYLDQLYLETPGRPLTHLWKWDVGINVFASAGDGRWWQDHRIPGGAGFSMNSVGHMVKSAMLTKALDEFYASLSVDAENEYPSTVDSLGKALTMAMSTIADASTAASGKATWLVPDAHVDPDECGPCPVELPKKIEGQSHCYYQGAYHTDVTLPSIYFRDSIQRPMDATTMKLDFTYLFQDTVENPAFRRMGEGEQVRTDETNGRTASLGSPASRAKTHRQWPTTVEVSELPPYLQEALARRS